MSNDFFFSFRSVAREIIKDDGIGRNGLLGKGITGTMGRNGFFNMIYFGFYHTMKNWLPASSDSRLEFCRKVMLGLTAGTLGCCVNIPFDVAKSRIQGSKTIILYCWNYPSLPPWVELFDLWHHLILPISLFPIPFSLFPISLLLNDVLKPTPSSSCSLLHLLSQYPMLFIFVAWKCRWCWLYAWLRWLSGAYGLLHQL